MTVIRRDTLLEFSEVDLGGDGDVQLLDIIYLSGGKMRLVNVYDQLRQEGGVRSQGRPAQTARWREIMEQEIILLGGDWNAHSDRWDPQCPPKREANILENLMDEYDVIDVTDGEETHTSMRNGVTSGWLNDFFITKASMADRLETSTDLATTSDHAIVCAQLRWDDRGGVKVSTKVTGWDIKGLQSKEEEENYKKHKKNRRTRAQRDLCWMRIAVGMIYRWKLSGYSEILLMILIGAAKRLRFARDLRGGGRWRSEKTGRFWDRYRDLEGMGKRRSSKLAGSEAT